MQAQSSFLSGRNGGPRPVQDLNKLAVDQIFGEYSLRSNGQRFYSFRFGKQALHYGVGSLLDIREANVRRSFLGVKFVAEHKNTKVDLFAMELMKVNPDFSMIRLISHENSRCMGNTNISQIFQQT